VAIFGFLAGIRSAAVAGWTIETRSVLAGRGESAAAVDPWRRSVERVQR